ILGGCDEITGPEQDDNKNTNSIEADAGDEQTVPIDTEVTLDGSNSSPSADIVYSWSLETPEDSDSELASNDAAVVVFTPDLEGQYTATLTITNGDDSDESSVVINAEALQEISGTINQDETLSSKVLYRVVGNLSVSGATLTIEPGTTLEFEQGTSLTLESDAILSAQGTQQDSIRFTGTEKTAGWWNGIFYSGATHPHNVMDHVVIEYGGREGFHSSTEAANLTVGRQYRGASMTLTNSSLRHSGGYGLHLHANGSMPDSERNTFTSNELSSVATFSSTMHYLDSGSSFTGNHEDDHIHVEGNKIEEDMIWQSLDVAYRMSAFTNVEEAELTIEAGAEFAFAAESGLMFGIDAIIRALGTEHAPILFTATEKVSGWWNGIFIQYTTHPNNLMDHVIIEYGGREAYHSSTEPANLTAGRDYRDVSFTLTNSILRHSNGVGMFVHSSAVMENSAGNTYTLNEEGPVSTSTNVMHYLDGSSTFTGNNNNDFVWVEGNTLEEDATWQSLDIPYGMLGTSIVNDAALVIDAGAKFAFDTESSLDFEADSQINADGTDAQPILFTGLQKTAGWWKGIYLQDSKHPDNRMDHVIIEYGGSSAQHSSTEAANLTVGRNYRDSKLTLTNSEMRYSGGEDIFVHEDSILDLL
ncbi:MAG: PKD domain-containing protein, partial [Balneolales bacterium]